MKIDTLLEKLAPLCPDKVRRWQRALDFADPELRSLLEKDIRATAYAQLGDFRQRLLLSLPPKTIANGALTLGTILYEEEKWPASLTTAELLQNMAIFGRSGAGKTNVVFHLLSQLVARKIPFLFLDWKRTARHLLPLLHHPVAVYTPGRPLSPFPFNPFIPPPGLEPTVYASHAIDVMGDAYTLGDAARSVLLKALRGLYHDGKQAPTTPDVLERVHAIPDTERVRGWKASAIRALETLAVLELVPVHASQASMVAALLQRSAIIELDALAPSNKAFLLPLLCLWLYYLKLPHSAREKLGLVIIVEEAHHLLHRTATGRESLMEMLLRQCREIGISIIVIDQHPHLISSAALGNTYTSICLNLKDPRDIHKAAALSLLADDQAQHLSLLPVGHGIVKLQDRWKRPFLVRFPLVPVQKGVVTDETLAAQCARRGTLSAPSPALPAQRSTLGGSRLWDAALTEEELTFLHDVTAHIDDGVDKRYKRLGISADKGHRLKHALLSTGVLEEQAVRIGRTRRTLLRVTPRTRRALGLASSKDRGSLAHEYWKRWHARALARRGFRVRLEAPRNKGRVDVLGTRAAESVAVEIETGKSDALANVRQDLLSGFHKILVVATDDAARERVETQLARVGLLSPRVVVVLRDRLPAGEGWR